MAHTQVAAWTGIQGNNVLSKTTAAVDTTGADLIVVAITTNSGTPTLSDSKSNTYTLVSGYPHVNAGDSLYLYYKENPTVGAGHTITITASTGGSFVTIQAGAWSGNAASSSVDQATFATGSSSAPNSGNVTTTQAAELIIGAFTLATGSNITWADAGSNVVISQSGDGGSGGVAALTARIVSATGSYAASAGTGGVSGAWVAGVVTFKGTAGGGGATIYNRKIFESAIFNNRVIRG